MGKLGNLDQPYWIWHMTSLEGSRLEVDDIWSIYYDMTNCCDSLDTSQLIFQDWNDPDWIPLDDIWHMNTYDIHMVTYMKIDWNSHIPNLLVKPVKPLKRIKSFTNSWTLPSITCVCIFCISFIPLYYVISNEIMFNDILSSTWSFWQTKTFVSKKEQTHMCQPSTQFFVHFIFQGLGET